MSEIIITDVYQKDINPCFPHDTLIALSRARSAVRGLLDQIDHPVAHFVLSEVAEHLEKAADHITSAMVVVGQSEAERIEHEDVPLKGI